MNERKTGEEKSKFSYGMKENHSHICELKIINTRGWCVHKIDIILSILCGFVSVL